MDHSDLESKISEILELLNKQNERISKLEKQSYLGGDKDFEKNSPQIPEVATYTPRSSYSQDVPIKNIVEEDIYVAPNSTKSHNEDIESVIGGKWLVKIGIFALLIGVGFFLRYAFQNWIGPVGQITIGYILGLLMIGAGEVLVQKYSEKWKNYVLTLMGGGIGILYITTFAAANYYELISIFLALIVSLGITAVASIVSLRNDSRSLLAISILGGFLSPILLQIDRPEGLNYDVIAYLVIINLGVMYIATKKSWKNINLLAMLATYLNLIVWRINIEDNIGYSALWIFLLFFLFFITNTLYRQFVLKQLSNSGDLVLLLLNAIFFYLMASTEIGFEESFRYDRATLTLILAGMYSALAYLAHILNKNDRNLLVFLTSIAMLFFALSVPLLLDNRLITLGWIFQSLIVLWIGFEIKSKYIRFGSYILFLIAIFRMIFVDLQSYGNTNTYPFLNPNFLELFASVMALYVGVYIFYQYKNTIPDEEFMMYKGMYVLIAQIVTLFAVTYEINFAMDTYYRTVLSTALPYDRENLDYLGNNRFEFIKGLVLSMWWLVFSFVTLAVGSVKNSTVLKVFSTTLLYLLILKVIFLDIMSNSGLSISHDLIHTITWTVAALIGIILGFYYRSRNYRLAALLFLGLMILKLFIFDTWNLGEIYRIVAYFSLGVILIIAGYIYVKYQDKIKDALL